MARSLVRESTSGKTFKISDSRENGAVLGDDQLKGMMALYKVTLRYEEDMDPEPKYLKWIILNFTGIAGKGIEVEAPFVQFLDIKPAKQYYDHSLKNLTNWIGHVSGVSEVQLSMDMFKPEFWQKFIGTVFMIDCTSPRPKVKTKYWVNVKNLGFNVLIDSVPEKFSKVADKVAVVAEKIKMDMAADTEKDDDDIGDGVDETSDGFDEDEDENEGEENSDDDDIGF